MSLPDLINVKVAALDTETYDPFLTVKGKGPGFLKGWGSYMIGFSYAIKGGPYAYIPTRHSHGNYEGDWKAWLRDLCASPDRVLIFANAKYDLEVLWSENIRVDAKIIDIQTNEAILNENQRSYSLGSIADRRALPSKGTGSIELALLDKGFSIRNKPDWTRLRDLPIATVSNYAELDAALTLAIHNQQAGELTSQGLDRVAQLESDLIPLFWQMRLQGVRVDEGAAENLNFELQTEHMHMLNDIVEQSGYPVNPFAAESLAKWCRALGYEPPKTEKENDSITNEWLKKQGNPYLTQLAEYRAGEKIRRDFVDALVLGNSKDGKVHPQWFSTRGGNYHSGSEDYNGTRTGRPSCVDPNLTQIPARHPRFGPAVRGLFLPGGSMVDSGQWGKFDYSAQEPRITIHYAHLLGMPGANEIYSLYQNNPQTDFHQATVDLIEREAGVSVTRNQAKVVNLGLAYGMGKAKLARGLGLTASGAEPILEAYHRSMPFMKALLLHLSALAARTGYVKTALGRRRRFEEWEQTDRNVPWEPPLADEHAARLRWGSIQRAGTYKALNAVVQGSAAEQTKLAMLQIWRELGMVPLVQVYDELGYTIHEEKQAKSVKEIMEGIQLFSVPHVVELQLADSWSAK